MAHRHPIDRTREQLVRARMRIEEQQRRIRDQQGEMRTLERRHADIRQDLLEADREIRGLTDCIRSLDQDDLLGLHERAGEDVRLYARRARQLRFEVEGLREERTERELTLQHQADNIARLSGEVERVKAERDRVTVLLGEFQGYGVEAAGQQPPSPAETEADGRENEPDDAYMSPGGRATST
ncbi:hypothetical protein LTR95_012232 [Oleoguttula sp. CCFEE 5521]